MATSQEGSTTYERALRDGRIAHQEANERTQAALIVAKQAGQKEMRKYLTGRMKDADRIDDEQMAKEDKAREKANKAAGMPKAAPTTVDEPFKGSQIGKDNADIGKVNVAEVASGGGAGVKEVAGAGGVGVDEGPLLSRSYGSREQLVTNAAGTFPMETRFDETREIPRGMTDYQSAMVKMAENKERAVRENEIRGKVAQGIRYNLTKEQVNEFATKSYMEQSDTVRGKVRAGIERDMEVEAFRDEIALRMTLTKEERAERETRVKERELARKKTKDEKDLEIDGVETRLKVLQLREKLLDRKKADPDTSTEGVVLSGYAGINGGDRLSDTEHRLEMGNITKKLAKFAEMDRGDINGGEFWAGVGIPAAKINKIPVVVESGKVSWGSDKGPSIGLAEPDFIHQLMFEVENSKNEKMMEDRKARLIDMGLIFDVIDGVMSPVSSGYTSVNSKKQIESYRTRVELGSKFGFGEFWDPAAEGVVGRRTKEISQEPPNPQAVKAIEAQAQKLLQETYQFGR